MPAVARVPQAPKGLLGLANLRGAVLPVASLPRPAGRRGAGRAGDARDRTRRRRAGGPGRGRRRRPGHRRCRPHRNPPGRARRQAGRATHGRIRRGRQDVCRQDPRHRRRCSTRLRPQDARTRPRRALASPDVRETTETPPTIARGWSPSRSPARNTRSRSTRSWKFSPRPKRSRRAAQRSPGARRDGLSRHPAAVAVAAWSAGLRWSRRTTGAKRSS